MGYKENYNIIDLFCGAGGMSKGFEKAGFNILLGIDFCRSSTETFKINHKNSNVLCEDLRNVSVSKIRKLSGHKRIDVVVGGPPCQGFSMAGKRVPSDPRNSLFLEFLRIVCGLRPKIFVMENVKGILSMKNSRGRKVIDIILNEFSKIDYNTNYYVVNTADYGIPQRRNRIFIVGIEGKSLFNFPKPSHSLNGVSNNSHKLRKWVGINKILLDKKEVDKKYYYSNKLIRGFKRRERMNKKRGVGYGWQFIDPNKPCYTISARYWKDGAEALVKYADKSIRMLTPEECSRIQSFPKSFKFVGSKREIYTQIGNAVPPSMSYNIAKNIYENLIISKNG